MLTSVQNVKQVHWDLSDEILHLPAEFPEDLKIEHAKIAEGIQKAHCYFYQSLHDNNSYAMGKYRICAIIKLDETIKDANEVSSQIKEEKNLMPFKQIKICAYILICLIYKGYLAHMFVLNYNILKEFQVSSQLYERIKKDFKKQYPSFLEEYFFHNKKELQ